MATGPAGPARARTTPASPRGARSDRRNGGDRGSRTGGNRKREASVELIVGLALVGVTALGGIWFHLRPGEGWIDAGLASAVGVSRSRLYLDIAGLHQPWIVVVGAVIAAAVTLPRDRPRALACLTGPPLALLSAELVAKPVVGRSFEGVLSYPSGSTVAAAALSAAAVLATPSRWRILTGALGFGYVLAMCTAVVGLRWHYPSDAAAGAALGVGVVLVVDGVSWWVLGRPALHSVAGREPPSR